MIRSFIRDVMEAHSYFSLWSLYMMMYLTITNEKNPRVHSRCLFYLVISCCGGTHITFIYPRRLFVRYLRYEFKGWSLILLDVLGHYAPLFYYLRNSFIPSPTITLGDLLSFDHTWLILLYMTFFPMYRLYRLRLGDLFTISIVATVYTLFIQSAFHLLH